MNSNWRMTSDGRTEPVYLCRCGVEHTGEYAVYDYGHHMCFHDTPLLNLGHGQVACPDCGKDWRVEDTIRSEYDIRGGVRGKYRLTYRLTWWQDIVSYLQALYR